MLEEMQINHIWKKRAILGKCAIFQKKKKEPQQPFLAVVVIAQ